MDTGGEPNETLLRIVETLEDEGVSQESYRLQETVDVEALERLVDSADDDVAVRLTVRGVRLEVTPVEVRVLETA